MKLTDADVKLIIKGNKKKFALLFKLYYSALCSYGYGFVQDPQISEDLVQESFIRLWELRKDFTTINQFKGYLYTSVKNKSLNWIKHQKIADKHSEQIGYEHYKDQYFESHIIEEETFNLLYQEIQSLPESAKKIMLLVLNGLKNTEIAETLEISVNTVKTQKKIAYARIKKKLGPKFTLILHFF